jgi:hypothetical protein
VSVKTSETLRQALELVGYTCGKESISDASECKCKCNQQMILAYIPKYEVNPDKKHPFDDPWVAAIGKNDYHFFKCDTVPTGTEGSYQCADSWSYVPGTAEITDQTNPLKGIKVETIDDPDEHSVVGSSQWKYCCCRDSSWRLPEPVEKLLKDRDKHDSVTPDLPQGLPPGDGIRVRFPYPGHYPP